MFDLDLENTSEDIIRQELFKYFESSFVKKAEAVGLTDRRIPHRAVLYFSNGLTQYDWYPITRDNLITVVDEFVDSVIEDLESWSSN